MEKAGKMEGSVRMDERFRPHPDFKKLYYAYLTIGSLIFYFSWAIPLGIHFLTSFPIMTAIEASFFLFLPTLVIMVIIASWIPRFHSSLSYLLTDSDIIVERGVWWKHKSIVPYNRVTNIDVVQGPLSRQYGLGRISIQTAGFSAAGSGGGTKTAEAVILGIKNFEEVKDLVVARVKKLRPVAVETGEEPPTFENAGFKILKELERIRHILESQSGKRRK